MNRKFSGAEKAAILLMDLGEEKAARVLENMDEREIQILGGYMSSLGNVDTKVMDSVNKDFQNDRDESHEKEGVGSFAFSYKPNLNFTNNLTIYLSSISHTLLS